MPDAADLDALFAAAPAEFTALRKQLADRAKKAGDRDGAAEIGKVRKPTTAAWVVNLVALRTPDARQRLSELGEELRSAHRDLDGERIRELSARQRRLVEELADAGFALAGLDSPTAALREDVTATLQAALADPQVLAQLGRLAAAQSWSGFGAGGDEGDELLDAVTSPPSARKAKQPNAAARKLVAAAEAAEVDAAQTVDDRRDDVAAAQERVDDLRAQLTRAEQTLAASQAALDAAEQEHADARAVVAEARRRLHGEG